MAVDWGYSKFNGPQTWAQCFPEAAGHKQSPIDIRPVNLKRLMSNDKLTWRYVAENSESVLNPGYCWKVHVKGDGSELSGGPLNGKYMLEQFHCHWGETDDQGSEHTINGIKHAGELHLVHWNTTKYSTFLEAAKHPDGLCVLGIFLKPGRKHNELEKIVAQLSHIEFKGQKTALPEPINPGLFIPRDRGYYTYQGSLTTPPCSECVVWIVFKEPIEVSRDQLDAFRTLKSYSQQEICPRDDEYEGRLKKNYRPTLPVGQRDIHECRH